MKIRESLKREIITAGADNIEAVLGEGLVRIYSTGPDVMPKVSIRIEYPAGADMSAHFAAAQKFIREIEHRDQIALDLVDTETGEVNGPSAAHKGPGWRKD